MDEIINHNGSASQSRTPADTLNLAYRNRAQNNPVCAAWAIIHRAGRSCWGDGAQPSRPGGHGRQRAHE